MIYKSKIIIKVHLIYKLKKIKIEYNHLKKKYFLHPNKILIKLKLKELKQLMREQHYKRLLEYLIIYKMYNKQKHHH